MSSIGILYYVSVSLELVAKRCGSADIRMSRRRQASPPQNDAHQFSSTPRQISPILEPISRQRAIALGHAEALVAKPTAVEGIALKMLDHLTQKLRYPRALPRGTTKR
jgi:hypothetical protein